MLGVLNVAIWLVLTLGMACGAYLCARKLHLTEPQARVFAAASACAVILGVLFPWSNRFGSSAPPGGSVVMAAPDPSCAAMPTSNGVGVLDGMIDSVSGATIADGGSLASDRGFQLRGWAVAADKSGPSKGVCLFVDGNPAGAVVAYGAARPDVAANFHQPADVHSEYTIDVAVGALSSGTHVLTIGSKEPDGTTTFVARRNLTIP